MTHRNEQALTSKDHNQLSTPPQAPYSSKDTAYKVHGGFRPDISWEEREEKIANNVVDNRFSLGMRAQAHSAHGSQIDRLVREVSGSLQ
jgi:hypothetical protein